MDYTVSNTTVGCIWHFIVLFLAQKRKHEMTKLKHTTIYNQRTNITREQQRMKHQDDVKTMLRIQSRK
jgi:hypothetical protein